MLDNLEYPIHEKNNVSQDTESNEPDTVTLIEMWYYIEDKSE